MENEDEVSIQRNITLLHQEFSKPKPRVDTVVSLMRRTFIPRRQWILDNVESVAKIVEKYPFLAKATYVSVYMFYAYTFIILLLKSHLDIKGIWSYHAS